MGSNCLVCKGIDTRLARAICRQCCYFTRSPSLLICVRDMSGYRLVVKVCKACGQITGSRKMSTGSYTPTIPKIPFNNSIASSISLTPSILNRKVFFTSLRLVRRILACTNDRTCLNIGLSKYGDCWLVMK